MSDVILEQAIKDKRTLIAEREAIDLRLADLDAFIRMHALLSQKAKGVAASAVVSSTPQVASHKSTNATKDDVLAIAKEMLSAGNWAQTETITKEIKTRGLTFTAQNEETRVSQILSASNLFQSRRGLGWALKSLAGSNTPSTQSQLSDMEL